MLWRWLDCQKNFSLSYFWICVSSVCLSTTLSALPFYSITYHVQGQLQLKKSRLTIPFHQYLLVVTLYDQISNCSTEGKRIITSGTWRSSHAPRVCARERYELRLRKISILTPLFSCISGTLTHKVMLVTVTGLGVIHNAVIPSIKEETKCNFCKKN